MIKIVILICKSSCLSRFPVIIKIQRGGVPLLVSHDRVNNPFRCKKELFEIKLFEIKLFEIKLFEIKLFEIKLFEIKLFEIKLFEIKLFEMP